MSNSEAASSLQEGRQASRRHTGALDSQYSSKAESCRAPRQTRLRWSLPAELGSRAPCFVKLHHTKCWICHASVYASRSCCGKWHVMLVKVEPVKSSLDCTEGKACHISCNARSIKAWSLCDEMRSCSERRRWRCFSYQEAMLRADGEWRTQGLAVEI